MILRTVLIYWSNLRSISTVELSTYLSIYLYPDAVSIDQNQNCLLVIRPKTIIHLVLSLGELVSSPHKRSKLNNSAHSEAEISESVREFQSHQHDGRTKMKSYMQWSPVYDLKGLHLRESISGPLDQQASAKPRVVRAPLAQK